MPGIGLQPAAEEQKRDQRAHQEDRDIFAGHEQKVRGRGIFDHEARDEFGFRLRQVEGRAIGFRERRDEEQEHHRESSGLAGTNYQIFVFREAPSSDVAPERYGIVEFAIDVENPAPPLVNTNAQRQSIFTVEWDPANPPDDIQNWDLWYSTDSMPTPERTGKTASGEGQSKISISADELNLSEGESATLYARAYDIAFVSDNFGGNASDLSAGVPVTVVAVAGYCDLSGNCGGCSVSPLGLAGRTPSSIFLAFGFAFAALLAWRLRR